MMGLPIAFAAPWALVGLIALPAIWWLLKITPPRPESVTFPPLRLLLGIRRVEETPARMPWWLAALRLLLAALVIVAAAGPSFRPAPAALAGTGPLWLLIDNGFAAAPDWADRTGTAAALIDAAASTDRPVVLVATADGAARDISATSPDEAARRLASLAPRAWFPDRGELAAPLAEAARLKPPGDLVYIAESADDGSLRPFLDGLATLGAAHLQVITGHRPAPLALRGLTQDAGAAAARLTRVDAAGQADGTVRLFDRKGRLLDEQPFAFPPGDLATDARFSLPLELRNEVARADVAGLKSASAVQLLDEGWRRRTVGIIAGSGGDRAQPLLAPDYFLGRALSPFADILRPRAATVPEAVEGFVADGAAALILADVGRLTDEETEAAGNFLAKGGVLIRFAGPRFAAAEDSLVPVPLRRGDRVLGGSLSWEKPQRLGGFAGPFADIEVPQDVTVERQVLAEPSIDLEDHTWARLADGTPLVTARQTGAGWLVLFHVTADTRWSNLAISGAFVEMLRRSVALGHGGTSAGETAAAPGGLLPPLSVLNGYGELVPPTGSAHGLSGTAPVTVSRTNPPGFYGSEDGYRAVNLMTETTTYRAADLSALPAGTATGVLFAETGRDLAPDLFAAAFLLLLLDGLAILWLAGRLRRRPAIAVALILGAALLLPPVGGARAAGDDAAIVAALSATRLAYVKTGDATIDETSRAGLWALSQYLAGRTSLEPGEPMAVDPGADELALYPLIYWPIAADAAEPSREAMARVESFMKSGGTVLFDTRDQLSADPSGAAAATPEQQRLRTMLADLDIPPLEPVPADHVLTKSFYLLDKFVGRYADSPLWVEASAAEAEDDGSARPVRSGDGVSPILITGNDLAGGWAADENGSFLYPLVPGNAEQRDYAFRAGVNIVMYVLTGNYKADQVHVPALLERLGQ